MKKLFTIFAIAAILFTAGCQQTEPVADPGLAGAPDTEVIFSPNSTTNDTDAEGANARRAGNWYNEWSITSATYMDGFYDPIDYSTMTHTYPVIHAYSNISIVTGVLNESTGLPPGGLGRLADVPNPAWYEHYNLQYKVTLSGIGGAATGARFFVDIPYVGTVRVYNNQTFNIATYADHELWRNVNIYAEPYMVGQTGTGWAEYKIELLSINNVFGLTDVNTVDSSDKVAYIKGTRTQ